MFKFEDTSVFSKEAVDSALKSYSTTAKGFQAIATEAADYTKKSVEANFAHFEKLLSVKSFEAAFELQSAYAKTAVEAYVAEMTKIAEMYQNLAKEAYKPVEDSVQKSAAVVKQTVDKAAAAAA